MWREVLGGLCLLGAFCACTQPLNRCEVDTDCRAGASCLSHVCIYDGELGGDACDRPCATYEACSATTLKCQPRYTGLVVTPGDATVVDGGVLPVRAELRVTPGYEPRFPATLSIRVARTDGGTVVLPTTTQGEGSYTTQWTPSEEGAYRLTAAHPEDGGPSTTVGLTVDKTGPVLALGVEQAPTRAPDGGFVYADPGAPPRAWRRDETAVVRVESTSADLDVQGVSVLVRGLDGGVNLEGLTLAQAVPCDGKAYCGTVAVPLWKPGMPAFRGEFAVEVRAKDRVGNPSTVNERIPVTRWKWRYDVSLATITAAPAVGSKGILYVGTTNGSNNDGRLLAIADDGRLLWAAETGAVVASPAVGGALPDGTERVYAAHKKSNLNRVGFYAGSNSFNALCPDFSSTNTLVQSALAVGTAPAGSAVETAYGIYSGRLGGTLFAVRPTADSDPQLQCPVTSGVGDIVAPGTMLASASSVTFGASNGRLKSYSIGASGIWNSTPLRDEQLGLTNPTALAVVDGRILGGSNDGSGSKLFNASLLDGGTGLTSISTSSPAWNVSVGSAPEPRVLVGLNSNALLALDLADGGTTLSTTPSDVIKGAPVRGASGYAYTASSTSGLIQARRSLNAVEWQFDSESPIEASMNLDCSRSADGGVRAGVPGVLYAAGQDGKVFALVVDSPGLDSTAPWPRYQHDSRNTGNPETPITSCP